MPQLFNRAICVLRNEGLLEFIKQSKNHLIQNIRYLLFSCAKITGNESNYYTFTEKVHREIKSFDVDKYNIPINPYKLLWISTDNIVKVTRRTHPVVTPKPDLFGRVKNGNWDRRTEINVEKEYETNNPNFKEATKVRHGCTTIDDTVLYQSFEEHFNKGVPWEDTELYQWYDSGVYKPDKYKSAIDELFEKHERIYENIATDGYKTQREIGNQPFPWDRYEEIIVDIGRDGEFLLVNGRHRLSIAKILGLSKVPIVVSVRHKKRMDRLETAWETDETVQHPDFAEVNTVDNDIKHQ